MRARDSAPLREFDQVGLANSLVFDLCICRLIVMLRSLEQSPYPGVIERSLTAAAMSKQRRLADAQKDSARAAGNAGGHPAAFPLPSTFFLLFLR